MSRGVDAVGRPLVLRGLEGAASAAYFDAFPSMLGPSWAFPGRVRRPARDPVNALLNFGYTLATAEVARHLLRASFDLRIGLLHGIRYGRESLALDLVEELRAPLVDRFTLRLLHRRQIQRDDFITHDEDGAVRLTDDARRRYLEWWEEALSSRAPLLRNDRSTPDDDAAPHAAQVEGLEKQRLGPNPKAPNEITWRFRIERQAHRLARFLLRQAPFKPLQATRDPKNHIAGDGGDSQPVRPVSEVDETNPKTGSSS